ncbi:MAG TPA: SpoIIE family protein phosphatase [Acidimicrobiales bacterium]|nr:SpoIIE family protein phosphatase [Acidimicrobiales bacterium]
MTLLPEERVSPRGEDGTAVEDGLVSDTAVARPRTTPVTTADKPRLQRAVATFGLAGVVILGLMAASVGFAYEQSRAAGRDEDAVVEAAAALEDQLVNSIDALGAVGGLAVDGEVSPAEFETFASALIDDGEYRVIAHEVVVDAGDRAAWEAENVPIREPADDGGELVPAGERDQYLPVIDVYPDDETTEDVLGFDLAGESSRAAATERAAEERRAVLGGPVRLAVDGSPGVLVVQPLYSLEDVQEPLLVGFVSGSLVASELVDGLDDVLPSDTAVAVEADGTTLAGEPGRGAEATVRIAGEEWVVSADDPRALSAELPAVLAAGTLALTALLLFSARRDRRYQEANDALTRRLADEAARDAAVAAVANELSLAADTDAVARVVTTDAAAVVGADYADVGLLEDADHLTMSVRGAPVDDALAGRYRRLPLDAHIPTSDAVRERRLVVVEDMAAYQSDHPELLADVEETGTTAVAAAPLLGAEGEPVGVLVFLWGRPVTVDDRTRTTIENLARLCGQTLGRTRLAGRTAQVAQLAGAMAVATSPADVADRLSQHARTALGAAHANVRLVDRSTGTLRAVVDTEVPDGVADRYHELPLDASVPLVDAVRLDEPIWLHDLAEQQALYPASADDARAAGFAATASIPLHDSSGDATGAVAFAWPNPMRFDAGLRATLSTVADVTGQTLERTRLAAAHQRRAEALGRFASVLAATTTRAGVASAIAEHVPALLDARQVRIAVADPTGATLVPLVVPETPTDDAAATGPTATGAGAAATDGSGAGGGTATGATATGATSDGAIATGLASDRPTSTGGTSDGATPTGETSDGPTPTGGTSARASATGGSPVGGATAAGGTSDGATPTDGTSDGATPIVGTSDGATPTGGSSARASAAAGSRVDGATTTRRGTAAVPVARVGRTGRRSGRTTGGRMAVAVEQNAPAVDAFRSNDALTFRDAAATAARYAGVADELRRTGLSATAHLPLRDPGGKPSGVLSVSWPGPVTFDASLRVLLATVADLVGQTLERATLHEGEHAVVAALQRRLLTPPPEVEGLDVAVHYEPASGAVGIGGDWYDTVALEDGGLVVVVGDVTGHGVQAVAAMAQLQYLIAGLIRTGTPLDRVFAQANDMVAEDDGIYATAQVLHVDHRWHRLGYLSAGHPPALVRRPDGTVHTLSEARQPLLGMPLTPTRLEYVEMPAGSVVLAYTDGLVERRARAMSASIASLARELAAIDPSEPPAELLERLVGRARRADDDGSALDDDVAAVIIRVHT